MNKENLILLLKQAAREDLVKSCLEDLNHKNLILSSTELELQREQQLEVLIKRSAKANQIGIIGFDQTISSLRMYDGDKIFISTLSTNEGSYFIYLSQDKSIILSIQYNPTINKEKYLELQKEYESDPRVSSRSWVEYN